MKISCTAVDNNPEVLATIKKHAAQCPDFHLDAVFDHATPAIDFLTANRADLLFIDINMPGLPGMELMKRLPWKPMIVFTSDFKNFAIDGFELGALDYLLKPFILERFIRAVSKARKFLEFRDYYQNTSNDAIFVRSGYELAKIRLSNVEYIESLKDYVKIYQTNERPVISLMPLKKILAQLPADRFKRIHRSYIIPVDKVRSVSNRKVQLTNRELPLSQSYSGLLQEWVK